MPAATRDAPRLLAVAYERGDIVSGFHQRVENRAANVTGGAGQEDPHAGVYHSSVVARDTLIDFFHDFSRTRGEFLVYDDGFRSRSYSYEETARRAKHFAVRLHDLGLRQGDAVVFWSENRPEWIAAFWACLLRGIVVVPIDYRSSQEFLLRVSRIVSAKLVLVGQEVSLPRESEDAPIWKLHELEWPENEPRALAPID